MTPGKGSVSMTATVTQRPFGYPGSAVGSNSSFRRRMRCGDPSSAMDSIGRTLTFDNRPTFTPANPAPSVTLSGRIENPGEKVCVYVGIDGIDRALATRSTCSARRPRRKSSEKPSPRSASLASAYQPQPLRLRAIPC